MIPKASLVERIRHWFRIRFYGTKLVSASRMMGTGGFQVWAGRYGFIYTPRHIAYESDIELAGPRIQLVANELRLDALNDLARERKLIDVYYTSLASMGLELAKLGWRARGYWEETCLDGEYTLTVTNLETGITETVTAWEWSDCDGNIHYEWNDTPGERHWDKYLWNDPFPYKDEEE